ncbi:MAG: hypothetical protein IT203_02595 [Fimbriimonadaceae bacterium]|nr:hypothetical protein [Fimbriimonadaceae bacterium]
MSKSESADPTAISNPTNDGEFSIEMSTPYVVAVKIQGTSPILFHRWSCDDVEAKASAAKGSKAKKEDNIESYVYRNESNQICIPGEYLRGAIIQSAKFRQDPRSPRKSGMDLFKAGVVSLDDLCPITASGKQEPASEWDYLDRRRVMIQRNAVTRIRPAFLAGWSCEVLLQVLTPEYIPVEALAETISQAGRLVGVADFRPTFGRFALTGIRVE